MIKNKFTALVVDDEAPMRSALEASFRSLGVNVISADSGDKALDVLSSMSVDIVISDIRMPGCDGLTFLSRAKESFPSLPIIMVTAYGTISQAVDAMRLGAFDFITKPFSIEDVEKLVSRVQNKGVRTSISSNTSKPTESPNERSVAIVTNNKQMKELLQIATHIASSTANVLIQGESGTGKELISQLLHFSNQNVTGDFVAVNCAALPENLLESELFGHEKGSFTGALSTRIGKFEQADGGTLLLDEITEMPLSLQAKLLRVLQEREVDRVGGSKPIPVNVRVVATTNRNIQETVAKGDFREDLYYRLNVIPLLIPPLRERKEDIKLLAEYFVRKFSKGEITSLDEEVASKMMAYPWPGNIRELQNAAERAVLLARGESPGVEHFMLGNVSSLTNSEVLSSSQLMAGTSVAEVERQLIFETLKVTDNNKTKAAEMLGISIRTLRNKLNEYAEQKLVG